MKDLGMCRHSDGSNLSKELTPGPRPEKLEATIEHVRDTCSALAGEADSLVRVDRERLEDYVTGLDAHDVKRASHYMGVPIEFADNDAEVSFLITQHLFNFGHGFRHPLHEVCGRGAWQTMKLGVETWHQRSPRGCIDARGMADLTHEQVCDWFGMPRSDATESARAVRPLRHMIVDVAHSTGQRLLALRCDSFADFVAKHTNNGRVSGPGLVEALADHFPAFDDRRVMPDGQEVLFLKKAQIAVAELYQRLGASGSGGYAFDGVERFTVVCDNVLPCVLRTLGILRLDDVLAHKIDQRIPLPAGPEEAQLRAAGITAAELILERAGGRFWAKELGDYLWTLGKDPVFRRVERHATLDTCFY